LTAPPRVRRKLRDHQNNTHRIKLEFASVKGYILATPFEDTGMPGEIFIELSKEGSTVSGLVKGWATMFSYALQAGIPFQKLVAKFSHTKFEPSGFSPDPDIRFASSMYDAIVRKLSAVFLTREEPIEVRPANSPYNGHDPLPIETALAPTLTPSLAPRQFDAMDSPVCDVCGTLTRRSGANCYICASCGTTSGCS